MIGLIVNKKQGRGSARTPTNSRVSSPSKVPKEYLIMRRNEERKVREYELEMSAEALSRVKEVDMSSRGYGQDVYA